ncbi:hypothetical protein ATY41_03300 [Leifsonia xyli subsp. xyli]|uniref:Uncharacterized protein n=1 Tax=Leifsonia xyli subsp. xyli TaxID=59736 RepID=A0A1E2SJX5_LEIXY|nr:hypothetical protein [Leifsonia xyli]ODA90063.1 hypothetical protein ATY41_03300 [Leifsonia xyli subsp. xyli]
MSTLRVSPGQLRAGASNTGIIEHAITTHPVHQLTVGDIGHAGVAAALNQFREASTAELRLRQQGTIQGEQILTAAASDTERVDTLLAQAATRMVNA